MLVASRYIVVFKLFGFLFFTSIISPFFVDSFLGYFSSGRIYTSGILLAFNLMCFVSFVLISMAKTRYRAYLALLILLTIPPVSIFSAISSNNFPSLYDFYFLWDARAMATDAASMYQSLIIENMVAMIPLVILVFLFPRKIVSDRVAQFTYGLYALSIVLFIVVLQAYNIGAGKGIASPTLIPAYLVSSCIAHFNQPEVVDRGLPIFRDAVHKKNIVLIIDESIRWDYVDLNHDQGTTPSLMKIADSIHNFHKSYSYANCSSYSNILIRTMARYGHEAEDGFSGRTLWEALTQAGYKNYLIDAQQDGKNHDYFNQQELNKGKVKVLAAKKFATDVQVADLINQTLNTEPNQKHFMMVIKKGAHAPYNLRDKDQARFKPIMETNQITKELDDHILNSYQSKIYENTDQFFAHLKLLDDTVYIYTSDHGQNLKHLDHSVTHCTTQNPTENEGLVPLLLLGSHQSDHSVVTAIKQRKQGSHTFIPFLILGYAGYRDSDVIAYMGNLASDEQLMSYLYGNVMSITGAGSHRFSQIR